MQSQRSPPSAVDAMPVVASRGGTGPFSGAVPSFSALDDTTGMFGADSPKSHTDSVSSGDDFVYEHVPVASISLSFEDEEPAVQASPRTDVLGNVLGPAASGFTSPTDAPLLENESVGEFDTTVVEAKHEVRLVCF
jgi:hypothetical protein